MLDSWISVTPVQPPQVSSNDRDAHDESSDSDENDPTFNAFVKPTLPHRKSHTISKRIHTLSVLESPDPLCGGINNSATPIQKRQRIEDSFHDGLSSWDEQSVYSENRVPRSTSTIRASSETPCQSRDSQIRYQILSSDGEEDDPIVSPAKQPIAKSRPSITSSRQILHELNGFLSSSFDPEPSEPERAESTKPRHPFVFATPLPKTYDKDDFL